MIFDYNYNAIEILFINQTHWVKYKTIKNLPQHYLSGKLIYAIAFIFTFQFSNKFFRHEEKFNTPFSGITAHHCNGAAREVPMATSYCCRLHI